METLVWTIVGYLAWCCLAFVIARYMKIEDLARKPISFLYVILAAPMVVLDYLTGKGTFR